MRFLLQVMLFLSLVSVSSDAYAQNKMEHASCIKECVIIHQYFVDNLHFTIPLICEPNQPTCRGKGSLRIDGKEQQVQIRASFGTGRLKVQIATKHEIFGSRQKDYFSMTYGPTRKTEIRNFGISHLPNSDVIRLRPRSRKTLRPVLRTGVRIPGKIQIEYQRPEWLNPKDRKSSNNNRDI